MSDQNNTDNRLGVLVKLFTSIVLILALCLPASHAFGANGDDDWNYAKKDPCAKYKLHDDEKDVAPPAGGDGSENSENAWLTPGTEAYSVAKAVFDTLVDDYGWSGAAACGVLGNIKGESGFIPDRAQGVGTLRFGMNSKEPPAGLSGGGGGLVQFTPYTKFTDSEYWGKIDSDGWGVRNQIAFMWDSEFANRYVMVFVEANAYGLVSKQPGSLEGWLSTNDPAEAAMWFFTGYERAAAPHPERKEWAVAANAVFNTDNKPADPSKWKFDDGGVTTPGIDGSSSAKDKETAADCGRQKKGIVSGSFIEVAKQYAADDSIGYSQSTRNHNPNMDCSSFVWYCLVDSKTQTAEELGGSPFNTETMKHDGILEACGWYKVAFTSMADLQPGDILLYSHGLGDAGHTAIYLGEGQIAEASGDLDGKDGDSSGQEVKVGPYWGDGDWEFYFRKVA